MNTVSNDISLVKTGLRPQIKEEDEKFESCFMILRINWIKIIHKILIVNIYHICLPPHFSHFAVPEYF